jgi:hypothetical protein
MSAARHTPGPWTFSQVAADWTIQGPAEPDRMARVLSIRNGVLPYPADASLISAAPDLLAACRGLLVEHISMNARLREHGEGFPEDGAHPDCPTQVAWLAILKAEGGVK